MSARELMKLPPEKRNRLVREALALAADEEFEVFEACLEEKTCIYVRTDTFPAFGEGRSGV